MAHADQATARTNQATAQAAEETPQEDRAVRESCGLLDRSERGKLALSGAGALEFLNGQVTNELLDLRPGEGRYAAFLTHKGKMLGDLRILAVADASGEHVAELALDTERVALQSLFDMIGRYKIGYDVELHKRTLERGLLSLIGPDAQELAGAGALGEEEHDNVALELAEVPALAVRTDLGVDLLCDGADTQRLGERLRERGAVRIGERTAERLRVERGRPRYGVDIDDTVIPQEAGLNERAVSFTKGCYTGQETVARLFYRGKPNRHLRGLALSEPLLDLAGREVRLGERVVGRVASAALSPTLGPIALALLRREAEPGMTVRIGSGESEPQVEAEVVELPFAAGT